MKNLADPTTAALTAADALERAGLPAAVYGGLALAAYGEPRETRDADFAVASVDAAAALAALHAAGIDATLGFADVRFGGNEITRFALLGAPDIAGLNVVDLVRPRSQPYGARLLARSLTGRLGGSAVRIVSPEDFVILKVLSTRDRDLEDAASVMHELGDRLELTIIAGEIEMLATEITDHAVRARWERARAIGRAPAAGLEANVPTLDEQVAGALRTVAARHERELDAKRTNGEAEARADDFLWKCLLRSYATLGAAGGWKRLTSDPSNELALAFSALAALPPDERAARSEAVFRAAGVRYPRRKAAWLSAAFERVSSLGGTVAASRALVDARGRDAKLRFLKQFPGVGAKYARNLMMDLHDADFRESVAVDSRILAFARDVGLTVDRANLELRLLDIARLAGIDGWTCDRVLFNWSAEVLSALGISGRRRKRTRSARA